MNTQQPIGEHIYDSVVPEGIPAGARIILGYVDGHWPNYDRMKIVHPHAYIIPITVLGKPGIRIADCEPGNLSPEHAAKWANNELKAGRKPTIYCSISTKPEIVKELEKLKISPSAVDWFGAHWSFVGHTPTSTPQVPTGYVALQFAAEIPHNGHAYDESVTNGSWPWPVAAPQTIKPIGCN